METAPVGLLPDPELVRAVVDRGTDALEELYHRHSHAVMGVARRVTGEQVLAEEVVQEVFLRLWRSPERFDPARGTLRAYLLIDAHGRAVELLRRDASRRGREDRSVRLDAAPPRDVEGEVWELVLAEHLREALETLTDGERDAIELAYFGGHSYRDVAVILGEPEGTVKSRIRTGLRRLKDVLLAVEIGGTP